MYVSTNTRSNGRTDEQKDEYYIPSTYFICLGYNKRIKLRKKRIRSPVYTGRVMQKCVFVIEDPVHPLSGPD